MFPQFGQPKDSDGNLVLPKLSQHGFARNSVWRLSRKNTSCESGTISMVFSETEQTLGKIFLVSSPNQDHTYLLVVLYWFLYLFLTLLFLIY